jgi:hypothetical protein
MSALHFPVETRKSRSHWRSGLSCRSAVTRLLGLRVRILSGVWMSDVRYNNNPLHLQRVGRRGRNKTERKKERLDNTKRDKEYTYNVTSRRVLATIFCVGKAINITYCLCVCVCVCVALVIQHAMRMRHIVTCDLPRLQ